MSLCVVRIPLTQRLLLPRVFVLQGMEASNPVHSRRLISRRHTVCDACASRSFDVSEGAIRCHMKSCGPADCSLHMQAGVSSAKLAHLACI